MNLNRFGDGACEKVRRYLDSYIDNELLVETNHDVIDHLEGCRDCTHELEARTLLKARLRRAGTQLAPPPDLDIRIQAGLRHYEAERRVAERRRYLLLSTAAILLLSLTGWTVLRRNRAEERQLARIGIQDHVHCAVPRDYSGAPPTPAQMDADMGPEFRTLIPMVREKIPADFRLEQAHHCAFRDRQYTHMIFRKGEQLLSLIITAKRPGEPAAGPGLREMEVDGFATAASATPRDFVFVVSNLDSGQNLRLAAAITPDVQRFLRERKGA